MNDLKKLQEISNTAHTRIVAEMNQFKKDIDERLKRMHEDIREQVMTAIQGNLLTIIDEFKLLKKEIEESAWKK